MASDQSGLNVHIHGYDLPGATFGQYTSVHVGLEVGKTPTGLTRGDASETDWSLTLTVRQLSANEIDFSGAPVFGTKQQRFLRLTWGNVDDHRNFTMFRRLKLLLGDIPRELLTSAIESERPLTASLALTGKDGTPECGSVRPPTVVWTI